MTIQTQNKIGTGTCAIIYNDFNALARHLLTFKEDRWDMVAQTVIEQAQTANDYRVKTGKPHSVYGTGTIQSALSGWDKVPEPPMHNSEYLRAIICVSQAILRAKGEFV